MLNFSCKKSETDIVAQKLGLGKILVIQMMLLPQDVIDSKHATKSTREKSKENEGEKIKELGM